MRIHINTTKLEKNLDGLKGVTNKHIVNALMGVGFNILEQAEPKAPIYEGTLIGSGYAQVGKDNISQNPSGQSTGETPPKPNNPDIKNTELRVGYTVDYAAKLHENPFNPGAKSIQKGLEFPAYKWLKNVADIYPIKKEFEEFLKDELSRK